MGDFMSNNKTNANNDYELEMQTLEEDSDGLENEFDDSINESSESKKKRKKFISAVAVIAIVLAVGVTGNWYYQNSDAQSTLQPLLDSAAQKTLGKAELVDATATTVEDNSYFSSARLDRQNAREASLEKLQSIVDSEEENEDVKKDAVEKIAQISSNVNNENKIETLVCAKGVKNCLAVVSEDGTRVDVIVDTDDLNDTLIMQIKDIAIAQTSCSFENISIVQSSSVG